MSRKAISAVGLTLLLALASTISTASGPPPRAEGPIRVEGMSRNLNTHRAAADQRTATFPATLYEDFEGSWPAQGWELSDYSTNDGGEFLMGTRDCHPRTGDAAGWSVGGGAQGSALACGDHYPHNASTWAIYGPFSLSDATSASLTFHLWGRSQGGDGCPNDFLFAGSSVDGSGFVGTMYCSDYSNGSAGNGYYRQTLNLNRVAGKDQVWIAFLFASDSSVSDVGFTIDDVSLSYTSPPPSLTREWSATKVDFTTSVAWGDYDNDGDLDLAVGNGNYYSEPNRLYRNDGGRLSPSPVWTSDEADDTRSIAWGDVDGDGDLDLAAGNSGVNRLYRNDGGQLTTSAVWSANAWFLTEAVAWGDYDGDGDLDLAAGNSGVNRLYRNDGGTFTATAVWTSTEADHTWSIAWGDVDSDGDLDLVAGNSGPNRLYRNDGGTLTAGAVWTSTVEARTNSVVWGDYDGDGDLDLAAGNSGGGAPDQLYRNDGGVLTVDTSWNNTMACNTLSVAWGDYDGDGDLDLAAGSWGQLVRLYRNDAGTLTGNPVWSTPDTNIAQSVAWGDVDGDGDLDLAVGNWSTASRLYRNDEGTLLSQSAWHSADEEATKGIAWGDYDGDGDLDLAADAGLYRNDAGTLTTDAVWTPAEGTSGTGVAWGDVDADGDLDLASGSRLHRNDSGTLSSDSVWASSSCDQYPAWADVDGDDDLDLALGGNCTFPVHLYRNDTNALTSSPIWFPSQAGGPTAVVAWGDVDSDGDPDLAVSNGCHSAGCYPVRLYHNDAGTMADEPVWSSDELENSTGLAWGDYDGDGDLDLAVGNDGAPARVYRNQGGTLSAGAVWSSREADITLDLAWGDADGDGDLDLFTANAHAPNRLYRNDGGALTVASAWDSQETDPTSSVAWGDVDGDGDLDLAVGSGRLNQSAPKQLYRNTRDNYDSPSSVPILTLSGPGPTDEADFFSSPAVQARGSVPITYSLFHRDSAPVREVRGAYSLNGGGSWLPAVPTTDTITTSLTSAPYPNATPVNTHVYGWDVLGSGVMGQYDNVLFRLVAIPAVTPNTGGVAGPYHYGSYAAATLPFRVRGSQVRVVSGTQPVANALVYRLPAEVTAGGRPYADAGTVPFRTNASGYMQGHGEIAVGDRLLALAPITESPAYALFYTNGDPQAAGVNAHAVSAPGEQTLQVSADHPLYLFNLDVSLEWDAHNDDVFLERLEYDLRRAAEHLYDFTDGQATIGEAYVFHDAENWQTAHMRVYATNRLRPNAAIGGIVTTTISDTQVPSVTYQAGQIRMPPTWNRYGDPGSGGIGEDWPRTLAHEMGHYYLFLDDHYLGLDETGQVVSIDACTETAMTDPYRYSEYRDQADWLPACEDTIANDLTGRSDWETISLFYPTLTGPDNRGANAGPAVMPFDLTEVTVFDPLTPTQAIPDPTFYFLTESGQRYQPADSTRGFLIKDDTWLVDVGEPIIDHILARGAKPGDRLCVFDAARDHHGCETIALGDDQMVLQSFPHWHPEILVSPVSTDTITVTVHAADSLELRGRVFSTDGPATEPFDLVEGPADTYAAAASSGGQALLLEGFVHVWVEENAPRREMITDYAIGASPGAVRGHGGAVRGHGGAVRGHGGAVRGHGGAVRGHGAPILSGDGQVTVYTPDPTIPDGEFLTIQSATGVPALPPGRVQIGQGYRIAATPGVPGLEGESSISFQYLGETVPAGMEPDITIYHLEEGVGTWSPLPTALNTRDNFASASLEGSGLYALLTSFRVPLPSAGWNLFSYPLRTPQSIPEALTSISGSYATLYGYDAADNGAHWKLYDVAVPDYVNTLEELSFGKGYWISVSHPITAHFGTSQLGAASTAIPPQVPATYFGPVVGGTAGHEVTAWVDDTLCGRSEIVRYDRQPVYAVHVVAEDGGNLGCGAPGREVTFHIDSEIITSTVPWDSTRPREAPIYLSQPSWSTYLPIVIRPSGMEAIRAE